MTSRWFMAFFLGASVLAGCSPASAPAPAPVDTAADVQAINALSDREIAAFSGENIPEIEAIFTDDVVLMPPGEPAIEGLAAGVAWAKSMYEVFSVVGSYSSTDVTVSGDLAVQQLAGQLTMTPKAGGDSMTEEIKGIHVLRRQEDGSWKIAVDVWNTDSPPPEAAEN
jgi:ketosteroid isomerase-like protein